MSEMLHEGIFEKLDKKICHDFRFEELTEEFLDEVTHFNALLIHNQTNNADELYNWGLGKKISAFTIVDCYVSACKEKEECPPFPSYCKDYIKEINIQELKMLKAFFVWECRNRKQDTYSDSPQENYFHACDELFWFCDSAHSGEKECTMFTEILSKIDPRKNELDRRLQADPTIREKRTRRKSKDYRAIFI